VLRWGRRGEKKLGITWIGWAMSVRRVVSERRKSETVVMASTLAKAWRMAGA
jgi:hypothetical protein